MTQLRTAFVASVCFTIAAMAQQQPQPEPKEKGGSFGGQQKGRVPEPIVTQPLIVVLLDYIGDETLTAELKLTPEQIKKLTDHRQQIWDAQYTSIPSEFRKGAAERIKATEALFKATLSPQQFERGRLLAARQIVRPGSEPGLGRPDTGTMVIFGNVVAQYPELATILNLTDDQKAQLAQPTKSQFGGNINYSDIRLDKEQTAAIEKALGPPPAKEFVAIRDPRMNYFALITPLDLRLLNVSDVQRELKLTPEQSTAFMALSNKWSSLFREFNTKDRSPQDLFKQAESLKAEFGDLQAKLNPDQMTRLAQITAQRTVASRPPHARYLTPNVEKIAGTTEPQKQSLAAIATQWEEDIAKAFDAGEPYEPTKQRVDAATAEMHKKSLAVFTPDQAAKVKAIYGEPYTGRFDERGLGDPRGGGQQAIPEFIQVGRRASFGRYSAELAQLARNPDVQAELKMTPDQIKKAEAAADDLVQKFPVFPPPTEADAAEKYYSERSAAIEKAIPTILDADQQKRFRQIMIQIRDQRITTRSGAISTIVFSAAAYPGVAEAIKLTPEQKGKLVAGDPPADVLTADQIATIKMLSGEPYKGRTSLTPTGIGTPLVNIKSSVVSLLTGQLDEALKITPDQRAKLTPLYAEYLNIMFGRPRDGGPLGGEPPRGGMSPDERQKAIAELAAKIDREIATVLTPDQMKRFPQLALQYDAAGDLYNTLRSNETSAALSLTPEQIQKINGIATDANKLAQLLSDQYISRPNMQAIAARLRERTDERLMTVLSDQQKAKWKELTGEPVNFPKSPIRTSGGFSGGGFSGGGGFPGGGFPGGGPPKN